MKLISVLIFTLLSFSITAAEYYVVVGTFVEESNARKFAGQVRRAFKDVSYSFNEPRKLYYVHVMKTPRKDEARDLTLYLRREKGFTDAWILAYSDSKSSRLAEVKSNYPASAINQREPGRHQPRYTSTAASVDKRRSVLDIPADLEASSSTDRVLRKDARESDVSWTINGDLHFVTGINSIDNVVSKGALRDSEMFTFVVKNSEGQRLASEVMLVDFEKVKKIAGIQSGENLAIKPTRQNQMVTFVCDVLGYSMETRMFNIEHLSRGRGIRRREDGVWEVNFTLRKLKVDEVAFLNNTTFYKDAAVLEHSAEMEMNDLVLMMQSNPRYEIIIHSHCNPGARRTIPIPSDKKYFEIEGAVLKKGSDRNLTKYRAETVRKYLIDHGIDRKRVGIVGWGSGDLLVGSDASDAYINDRIEIELVAE